MNEIYPRYPPALTSSTIITCDNAKGRGNMCPLKIFLIAAERLFYEGRRHVTRSGKIKGHSSSEFLQVDRRIVCLLRPLLNRSKKTGA